MKCVVGAVSEEVNLLIDEVAEAWTLLREHLKNFSKTLGHVVTYSVACT